MLYILIRELLLLTPPNKKKVQETGNNGTKVAPIVSGEWWFLVHLNLIELWYAFVFLSTVLEYLIACTLAFRFAKSSGKS